jgi:hypothetical protein
MTQRIYIVRNKADEGQRSRLILAGNPAQAMRHVANDLFAVKAASATDVAELMSNGVQLEKSKAHPDQMDLVDEAQPAEV